MRWSTAKKTQEQDAANNLYEGDDATQTSIAQNAKAHARTMINQELSISRQIANAPFTKRNNEIDKLIRSDPENRTKYQAFSEQHGGFMSWDYGNLTKALNADFGTEFQDDDEIRKSIKERILEQDKEDRDIISRSGWGGDAAGFVTGLGVSIIDPVNIAVSVAIPGLGPAAKLAGASRALRYRSLAGRAAGASLATEVVLQPVIHKWKNDLEIEYTFGDAVTNAALGVVAGTTMSTALYGMGRLLKRVRGIRNDAVVAGDVHTEDAMDSVIPDVEHAEAEAGNPADPMDSPQQADRDIVDRHNQIIDGEDVSTVVNSNPTDVNPFDDAPFILVDSDRPYAIDGPTTAITVLNPEGDMVYAGTIGLGHGPGPDEFHVVSADLEPEHQGKGLGYRIYQEIAAKHPDKTFVSGPNLSPQAHGLWKKLWKAGLAAKSDGKNPDVPLYTMIKGAAEPAPAPVKRRSPPSKSATAEVVTAATDRVDEMAVKVKEFEGELNEALGTIDYPQHELNEARLTKVLNRHTEETDAVKKAELGETAKKYAGLIHAHEDKHAHITQLREAIKQAKEQAVTARKTADSVITKEKARLAREAKKGEKKAVAGKSTAGKARKAQVSTKKKTRGQLVNAIKRLEGKKNKVEGDEERLATMRGELAELDKVAMESTKAADSVKKEIEGEAKKVADKKAAKKAKKAPAEAATKLANLKTRLKGYDEKLDALYDKEADGQRVDDTLVSRLETSRDKIEQEISKMESPPTEAPGLTPSEQIARNTPEFDGTAEFKEKMVRMDELMNSMEEVSPGKWQHKADLDDAFLSPEERVQLDYERALRVEEFQELANTKVAGESLITRLKGTDDQITALKKLAACKKGEKQ